MSAKRGHGHLNRLIQAMFEIVEDSNQTPELRVATGKILLEAIERRTPLRRRKSPDQLAIEQMLGNRPKKKTPFTRPEPPEPQQP